MVNIRFVGYVIFKFFLIFLSIDAYAVRRPRSSQNVLSQLLKAKNSKNPLVLIVDFNKEKTPANALEAKPEERLDYDYIGEDINRGVVRETQVKQNPLSSLSKLLKELEAGDDSSTTTSSESLELPKSVLRAAALRCRQVDNCVKKCPPKKPSCPFNCQQVFDNLNICDPPTTTRDPCRKNKCGKTMPPYWLF